MVARLGYKKNDSKMRGVALCQGHGPVVKALFVMCGSMWLAILDEVFNDYIEDVVGSQ